MGFEYDILTSIGAIFAGIVALILGYHNLRLTRKEINLSRRPFLILNTYRKERVINLKIENVGEGPALEIVGIMKPDNRYKDMLKLDILLEGIGVGKDRMLPFYKIPITSDLAPIIFRINVSISYKDVFNNKFILKKHLNFCFDLKG